MGTGQDQILGTDSVKDALKVKVNDDFSEVFDHISTIETEIENARDGKSTLLEKEQEQDTAIAALAQGEVTLISDNDTTPGFLNGKLVAGNGIVLTENNDGASETLSVHAGVLTGLTAGEDLSARDPVAINSEDGKVYKFRAFSEAFIDDLPETVGSNYGYFDMAVLDSTHIVAAYRRQSDGYGRVVVGEIQDDKTIDWGTPVTFNNAGTMQISITALTSSLFVVAYRDGGNSNYGTVIAGIVSDTSISMGSETVFWSNTTYYTDICRLDDSHFFVGFSAIDGSNDYCRSIVGSVDTGTIISLGTAVTANTGSDGSYVKVDSLDSTHAVIQDYASSNGTLRVAEINLSTKAISYPTTNTNVTHRYGDVVALDSTHFVSPHYNSNTFTLYLYSISGTTITEEDSQVVTTEVSGVPITLFKVDSNRVGVFYNEDGTTYNFCLITCSNDEIESWENVMATFLSSGYAPRGAMIDDALFIEINSSGYQIQDVNIVFSALAGFVNDDITSGNDADVYYSGVMTGFSGLSPGRTYNLDGDGTLKPSSKTPAPETNYRAGIAKSATDLLIQL